MQNETSLIRELVNRMRSVRALPGQWYAGITADIEQRLKEHNVDPRGVWYAVDAGSAAAARAIEKYFIERLGTRGGSGGGSIFSRFFYVYLITPTTSETA